MDDQADFGSISEVGDPFFMELLEDGIDPLDRVAVEQFINTFVGDVHDSLRKGFVVCVKFFDIFG